MRNTDRTSSAAVASAMRAIQESVARSRQAALERTLRRNAEEQAAQEALQQQEELRLEKERCLQARWDLIQAVNVAHEADALAYLEEMRGHVDMLVVSDEYGSTLLHEACARGMKRLATAVLQATAEAEEQKILFQRDYRGQTPLHRAAFAGSGEICAELCKLPVCRTGLKDHDGFTALQIAQRWGFSGAADAIFRAVNPMPELDLQVVAPPEEEEPPPQDKAPKGSGRLKPGKRSSVKDNKRGSIASSQQSLRRLSSRGSSQGRQTSKRSSLRTEDSRPVSRGSSQGADGKRSSLKRSSLTPQDRRRSSGGASRSSRPTSQQSSRQSLSREASRQSLGEDGGSRKNSQEDLGNLEQDQREGFSDAEGSTGEPASPEELEASPSEAGLSEVSEGPPPLPEDLGYQSGFQAVEDNRLDDAMALVRTPMWPFTNEVNKRGWTLLHVAAYNGLEELCRAMCQRKDFLGIDQPEKDFWATPLHLAAGKRRPECCSAIIESGRCNQVNAKDMQGRTALHLAALRADKESYAAIAAHPDCNPLLPDSQGKSALEYAADRGLKVDCQVPGHTEIDF